ncbi:MAG: ComF family protein [Saprospiraceae bacterium]
MLKTIQTYFNAFTELLYPNLCPACANHLIKNQKLCFECEVNLPLTDFHLHKENEVTEKFYGRIEIENGGALLRFTKSGRVQELIHELKYQGNSEIGIHLGRMYGEILKENNAFETVDLIIPVPLHPKKEKQRGYNQSDMIAQGLAQTMFVPWQRDILVRTEYTISQTKKSNFDRFENVKNAFTISKPKLIQNKHVLLVDDVLTTGATLEACALKALSVHGCKVSILVLAIAES